MVESFLFIFLAFSELSAILYHTHLYEKRCLPKYLSKKMKHGEAQKIKMESLPIRNPHWKEVMAWFKLISESGEVYGSAQETTLGRGDIFWSWEVCIEDSVTLLLYLLNLWFKASKTILWLLYMCCFFKENMSVREGSGHRNGEGQVAL